jgi:hypothetical protein
METLMALPEDEAKHWHREIGRLGKDTVMAEVHRIDATALTIGELSPAQRQQLRETLAALGAPP